MGCMVEITADNALAYLRAQGWLGPGPARVESLGGGVSNIPSLIEMAAQELPDWVFSDCFETPLKVNRWGDSSGVRGAARLACPRGPA